MVRAKERLKHLLRWSEQYTKTDMIYAARGGFWLTVGKIVLSATSFATMVVFANLLPAEIYGNYQFVLATVSVLTIFSLPGIKNALVRSVARGDEGSFLTAFWVRMKWSVLTSIALGCVGLWYFWNEDVLLLAAFLVAAFLFPLRMAEPTTEQFWQGRKQFNIQIATHLIVTFASAVAVMATLWVTDNLVYILLAFFGVQAVFGIGVYLFTMSRLRNHRVDKDMVSYGKSLTVMSVIGTAADHLDKILLFAFLPPAHLAVYSFAIDPVKKVKGFFSIKELALPKLSQHGVAGEARKKKVFYKTLRLFAVSVPAAFLLAVSAPYIYEFIFPQYVESVVYFQALTVLVAFTPFAIFGASLLAEMKTTSQYILQITVPSLKILFFFVLIPLWGIWGVVFAIVVAEIVRGVLVTFLYWRM
ncbi:MAG: oligosaccharide flippase family protein [Candidatus Paceibacterota bacterium]